MLSALIRKDAGLLRTYLRCAAAATICCYLVSGIIVVVMSGYQDALAQGWMHRTLMTLQGGSTYGFVLTAFFAAMLAGSIFTLERSDRSAEFLACLPPTRHQNLISKLTVAVGATLAMVIIHILAIVVAVQLVPYVKEQGILLIETPLPDALGVLSSVAAVTSVVGGALAASAWVKSNGAPILCGLLTPFLILMLFRTLVWSLDIPLWGDAFRIRITTSMVVLGLALGFSGCYWYLTRSEP